MRTNNASIKFNNWELILSGLYEDRGIRYTITELMLKHDIGFVGCNNIIKEFIKRSWVTKDKDVDINMKIRWVVILTEHGKEIGESLSHAINEVIKDEVLLDEKFNSKDDTSVVDIDRYDDLPENI